MSSTASTKWVFQTVVISPGAWYEFEGYVFQNDPLVEAAWLRVSWYESSDASGSAISTDDSTAQLEQPEPGFRYLTTGPVLAPAEADSANARIMLRPVSADEAVICIDDVSFSVTSALPVATATPTPTATSPRPTTTPTRTPTHEPTAPAPATPLATPRTSEAPTATPDPVASATSTPRPAAASPGPSNGLLVNGGFEDVADGELAGWSHYGGLLSQVADPVHGGRFAGALFSSSASTKWAYQTVPVAATQWYEMDAFIYHDHAGVETAWLRVSWYVSGDGSGSALESVDSLTALDGPEAGYRRLSTGPVQAPPGVSSARARIMLRPRSRLSALIYMDEVSFRAVSAPEAPAGDVEVPPDGDGDVGYAPPRRSSSGGGVTSEVLGASARRRQPLPQQPTPVIRRHALLAPEGEANARRGGETDRDWLWVLVAGVSAACASATAAYWRGWSSPADSS